MMRIVVAIIHHSAASQAPPTKRPIRLNRQLPIPRPQPRIKDIKIRRLQPIQPALCANTRHKHAKRRLHIAQLLLAPRAHLGGRVLVLPVVRVLEFVA